MGSNCIQNKKIVVIHSKFGKHPSPIAVKKSMKVNQGKRNKFYKKLCSIFFVRRDVGLILKISGRNIRERDTKSAKIF